MERHRYGPRSWSTRSVTKKDSGRRGDFRSRLSEIPTADEHPVQQPWAGSEAGANRPPVVRRAAPVARPATALQGTAPVAPSQPRDELGESIEAFLENPEPPRKDLGKGLRRRRRWPLVLFALLIIAGVLIVVPLFRARQVFEDVDRVAVSDFLTPPMLDDDVNILLVGTDSRSGIDGSTENFGLIGGVEEGSGPIAGERSDTIMVLRVQADGTSKFLSLPRDLWLPINGGAPQRINTAVGAGPEALINTVQGELGIPISHYVSVDLVGFIALVDAVGGVDISIPHPATDDRSGLNLPNAGPNTLDSTQALAYVRSRFYTELINGEQVRDTTSDLGRVQRQQSFMRALISTVAAERNPVVLNNMATQMAEAVTMDDGTTLTEAINIANTFRTAVPESVVLPTRNATAGSAAVLELTEEAPAVLAQFGASQEAAQ